METVAGTIQPVNNLHITNDGEAGIYLVIPSKEMIKQDPAVYIHYMMECMNRVRGDFYSLCMKDFPGIGSHLRVLSETITNLKREMNDRFNMVSKDNSDIRDKLDVLCKEIEYNKAMLERAIDDMVRNRKDMEDRILQSMNEVMLQNNDRFDMLSEQINILTSQRDTDTNQRSSSQKLLQRGTYTKQELDDKTLLLMSVEDLLRLRNNITSTKCRHKPSATGETNGIYEMCVANMDKINARIQQLRSK